MSSLLVALRAVGMKSVGNQTEEVRAHRGALSHVRNNRKRGAWIAGALLCSALLSSFPVIHFVRRASQVAETETRLKAVGADYLWAHETFDPAESKTPNPWRRRFVQFFGKYNASHFAYVRLPASKTARSSDETSQLLSDLRNVQSLELESPHTDDNTLALLGQFPDLRYLTLGTGRYSIAGLLSLRNSTSLRQLNLDFDQLTAIELAVLRSELAGVQVTDLPRKAANHSYEGRSHRITPGAV